jgi:hypothetical protein
MEKLIQEFADACRKNGLADNKKIKKYIFDVVYSEFKGKASKYHIKNVCDDIAESICLKLGIAC